MNTYKITNITNLAGKRDFKFNSELDIEYVDNMIKKVVKVKPNESIFLTVETLPLSVHRLRVKNLVTITEISKNELNALLESKKPKKAKVSTEEGDVNEETPKKSTKKKVVKKEIEE
jgi:hypothetical protein